MLRILREEKLAERASELGDYFLAGLRDLQQCHECIGDLRGRGLLIGLEMVTNRESRQADRTLAARVQHRALELGMVLHTVCSDFQSTMRFAPPLTATRNEIDSGLEILDQAIRDALDGRAPDP